jgi:hypothetical protein
LYTCEAVGIMNCERQDSMKAQLARLRRGRFGASSERIEREIEQFALALEEIEAAKAETTAPTTATSEAEASDTSPLPDNPSLAGKKKRRQLPPEPAAPRHRACASRCVQSLRRPSHAANARR